jgi:uncharacterized membrane protein
MSPPRPQHPAFHLLRTTLLGGLLFLLPLVLLVLILGKAIDLVGKLVTPALHLVGIERFGALFGIGGATLIAVACIVAVSLAAGLFAYTRAGRGMATRLEALFLGNLPQYRMAKSLMRSWDDAPEEGELQPILVRADPGWQLGYYVEDLGDGWVAVFLPQAPTPMSGNIVYLPASEIRATAMTMMQATEIIRRLGAGSKARLRDINLGSETRPAHAASSTRREKDAPQAAARSGRLR